MLRAGSFFLGVFLLFGGLVSAAQASVSPLVSVQWLKDNPAAADRVLVDLRDQRSYASGHIPGAVHSDYGMDGWRVTVDSIPGLMPTSGKEFDHLVSKIGTLGIGNSTHVVLIAAGWGAGDMGVATRLYWSFKVLGHDRVSILDGGMAAWLQERTPAGKPLRNPLQRGTGKNSGQEFIPALRRNMLMNAEETRSSMAKGQRALDARPTMQYMGLQQSDSVLQPGTLPGAISLPGQWVTENGGGFFRSSPALKKLFATAGPDDGEMFVFCNTGHWASLTWFVASELLGHTGVRMYDGSLAEWTAKINEPLEMKIRLN